MRAARIAPWFFAGSLFSINAMLGWIAAYAVLFTVISVASFKMAAVR